MNNALKYAITAFEGVAPLLAAFVPGAAPTIALAKGAVEAGQLITDSLTQMREMHAQQRDPTAAEWSALNTKIAELRKQLHSPD